MPTQLPNGVLVVNLTPHDLHFGGLEGGVVTAPSDGILSATSMNRTVRHEMAYQLTTVKYKTTVQGWLMLHQIRSEHPDAVIIGSSISAMTYRGEVVAPVPMRKGDADQKYLRLIRPDLFTVYTEEEPSNGSNS